jgi:UDP-N-acetyl-D-galactosamine dehydrogenase
MLLTPDKPRVLFRERPERAARPRLGTVAVVGLGYVGLPIAAAFGKYRPTIAYDLSQDRLDSLRCHVDRSGEVSSADLKAALHLQVTGAAGQLAQADFIIVTVPAPVSRALQPDFTSLQAASATVGRHMKPGAIVIFASTVYPGATEEICIPILEKHAGLRWRRDFHVAYSPGRIRPGEDVHRFTQITRVVSGDDADTLAQVAALYASVVTAGVFKASSIRVAEAATVIENAQRDLNIAFVNELAIIFDRIGLDTTEVLNAAAAQWNFLPFRPGLVGGDGAAPCDFTYNDELARYRPEVMLAGRRINDGMGAYIAHKTVQQMIQAGRPIRGARVNVLGLSVMENCADIRNSKVVDIIRELAEFGVETFVHDPHADFDAAWQQYQIRLHAWDSLPIADATILAVAHTALLERPDSAFLHKILPDGCLIDVKAALDPRLFREKGVRVWRL